ncbi:hypothetical protein Q0Z83_025680 [Actinoplanes sichuanensis]|nr:hypothetical protein Q0Z83_025680 [Actinoplanes sichuanensis]
MSLRSEEWIVEAVGVGVEVDGYEVISIPQSLIFCAYLKLNRSTHCDLPLNVSHYAVTRKEVAHLGNTRVDHKALRYSIKLCRNNVAHQVTVQFTESSRGHGGRLGNGTPGPLRSRGQAL